MNSTENYSHEAQVEQWPNTLDGAVSAISKRTNAQVACELMKEDGVLDAEALGGISEDHSRFIASREQSFAKIDDPAERRRLAEYYKIPHDDPKLSGMIYENWSKKKREAKSAKVEKFFMVLFRKALGPDFLVMRSSDYDDYKNSVDMIIVNKKTNEVIATFDDVHDRNNGERTAEKNKKIIKQAQSGGVSIEYVPVIIDGQITKKKYSNVPNFYLLSTLDEFIEAEEKMDYSNIDSLSNEFEEKLYTKFASAIIQQSQMLLQQEKVPNVLKRRLENVSSFFDKAA